MGIVSATGRGSMGIVDYEDFIQTDAAINPGNSGGPLLDSAGRLIGVNTAIYSPSGASAGIGFAIPVDTLQRVVPQVLRHGRVIRPTLAAQFLDDSISRRLGTGGVIVFRVERGGPAAEAGIRPTRRSPFGDFLWGDVIVAVDGKPIAGVDDLFTALEAHSIGDQIKLAIIRGLNTAQEQSLEVNVTLAAEKAE